MIELSLGLPNRRLAACCESEDVNFTQIDTFPAAPTILSREDDWIRRLGLAIARDPPNTQGYDDGF